MTNVKNKISDDCFLHDTSASVILLDICLAGMIDITREPLSSFIANNYRTAEIIAYIKSLCDE